jgi:hypothetical protein
MNHCTLNLAQMLDIYLFNGNYRMLVNRSASYQTASEEDSQDPCPHRAYILIPLKNVLFFTYLNSACCTLSFDTWVLL